MEVLADVLNNPTKGKDGWEFKNGKDAIKMVDGTVKHTVSPERYKEKIIDYVNKKKLIFNELYSTAPVGIVRPSGDQITKHAPVWRRRDPATTALPKLLEYQKRKWEQDQGQKPEGQRTPFNEEAAYEDSKAFIQRTIDQINYTGVTGFVKGQNKSPMSFIEYISDVNPAKFKGESLSLYWQHFLQTSMKARRRQATW
ncbi:MAG: hypothetical protein HC888_01905 [Candidatus Competibacteraceae bacterium]|nr:hypothetical protein [Candidatus Competibacteraceae bacterium]